MEISETVLENDPSTQSQPTHHLYRVATLQERFVSFIVDLLITSHLLLGWGLLLSHLLKEKPFAFGDKSRFLFLTTSASLYFLYYLLFEGTFTSTPGKLLGGLIIHKKGGGTPSLFAIFVRNLFRLVDYPLFFLTGAGLMETTRKCQRLGDLLSGTVVLRKLPFRDNLEKKEPAFKSVSVRSLAFGIDLGLILAFLYGLLLLIPVNRNVSVILLGLPLLTLLYITSSEAFFQTTFGKVLFGLKVVQENGQPATFASILVRNLFRMIDMNPLGYAYAVVSSRKQRPGDTVAGTVVVRGPRGLRRWMAIPYMFLLSALVAFLGWQQPASFYRKNYIVKIGSSKIDPIPAFFRRYWVGALALERWDLAFNATDRNERRTFDRGDVVFILFRISGFLVRNERAWIQADLKVKDPRRNIVLDRMNVINLSLLVGRKKYADLATRFALHPHALPGRYEVEMTFRDRFAGTTFRQVSPFWVH